ncbi:amino acid permease [candidate division KSB1 bacterium]|nr:amino acid permease [candidate division KSB1 bacterium]
MKGRKSMKLRRVISLPRATALLVGTIIGASIVVQPSNVTSLVPSVSGIIFVWLASGLLTLFGALVCAELASTFTQTGGVYVYLKEAFSPALGFLWGWAMFWVMHSGIIAALGVVFARYVAYFYPLGDMGIKAVAIGSILVLSAVNYFGVKPGTTLQTFITLGKVLAILLIITLGFALGSRLDDHFVIGNIPSSEISLSNFLLAMVAGLFTFGGWHMVTYNSEETVEPRKTIPRALIFGTLIVTFCYMGMNLVYMYILPLDKLATSSRIAADAADALFGFGGGAFMSGLVVFSTIGALTGIILAGPRVYYAMAQDQLLFRWMGEIHSQYQTPAKAIAAQGIWSSVLVATGTYRALFTRVIYTEWIFFGLMAMGLFLLRRKPNVERDYHIWGYPVVPAIFILASFAIVVNQVIADPGESFFGLFFVLAGLPVYYLWVKKRRRRNKDADY